MNPLPDKLPLVVVVNDDPIQLDILAGIVAKASVEVAPCHSVGAALAVIQARVPALIITDLYMPDIDGWTFCRLLRSPTHPALNPVPVIVVSATFNGGNSGEVAAELGANDFFSAPVDGVRLLGRVRALLANPVAPAPWRVLLAIGPESEAAELTAGFEAQGSRVRRVVGLAEVVSALDQSEWETAVIDLDLPGCDHAALARWTAAAPRTAFVVVGSDAAPTGAVASLRSGAGAHVRRPYAADYLLGLCHLARQKISLLRAQQLLEKRTVELRRSESLLQTILDASEQVHIVVEANGRVELFNESARRVFGELLHTTPRIGDPVGSVLPPALRRPVEINLARALAGEVVRHDADIIDRAGRRRRFIVRYTPLPAGEGREARVCFNAYDITARMETEDELRLRNQALGAISQGVFIAAADRRVTYVNGGYSAITGYTPAEIVGRRFDRHDHPDACPLLPEDAFRGLAAGEPVHVEYLDRRKDGATFWNEVTISPVKDARGIVTQFVGVQRDVTERKRQQDELAASQGRLQALFDHSNDGILLTDDSGRCVEANPAACRLLGYERAELIGHPTAELFATNERGWAEAAWREFLVSGRQTGECTLRRRDGSQVRADYNAIARILPGLHLSMLRDVTERHTLQAQLLRQQRLESVGRLASGVAHDLNNILTPILMAPPMLRMHVSDAGARMLLETIESGARRGSGIVRQLMTFARAESGDKVMVDLRNIVRDAGAMVRETFRKDIVLDMAPPPTSVAYPIIGDANQIHQAILNLALNGADAMPRGGRLVIALSESDITPAEASAELGARPGPHAVVTIADHGTGIAPEHLDKVFDPFFTTKPFGQGSGLGLSVVLGVARAHGGFVRVQSRVGVGTIVRLCLPLRRDPPDRSVPPFRPSGTAGQGRTILVVDDEAALRDVLRQTLAREGFRVLCADGVDAAFSQLQASGGRVDLILTDLAMPGVSGAKFIEVLRGRRPDLPILVLTGGDTIQDLPETLRPLVNGVVAKPCDAGTLHAAVAFALGLERAPDAAAAPLGTATT